MRKYKCKYKAREKIRVGAELGRPGSHVWAPGFHSPTPTRQCLNGTLGPHAAELATPGCPAGPPG